MESDQQRLLSGFGLRADTPASAVEARGAAREQGAEPPLERRLHLAAALLDGSPWATLAVDHEGTVLHANSAARSLLARDEGLHVSRGMLSARSRDEARALRDLIRDTAVLGHGGIVAVSREGKARPLFVRMVPLAPTVDHDPGPTRYVAVFVTDPDNPPLAAPSSLRVLYGLSEAEARLTQVLLHEGRSLRDAAQSCGITLNTAKTQLKRVFDKTGTRRRSDLVSLVLRSVGGL